MRAAFGALIAVILLGIFVYAIANAVSTASCIATNCGQSDTSSFTPGKELALSVIGGLLAALVTAELAVTRPGQQPMARTLGITKESFGGRGGQIASIIKIVTALYLLAWTATGLWAFVVGVLQHYKALQPLTDFGQTWLGLAITAVYAYFGIKPEDNVGR
jgi:predicted metal-binding membrane protein